MHSQSVGKIPEGFFQMILVFGFGFGFLVCCLQSFDASLGTGMGEANKMKGSSF